MGLFDFLFGKKPQAKPVQQPVSRPVSTNGISLLDKFAEIPSLKFFGQFNKSPSGEWAICWSDSDDEEHRGGHRNSGKGRYVLYNLRQDAVVQQGRLERPNSGHVADNGYFSIEDWHFGDSLVGTFYVFSATGKQLIKKNFKANLYNSAISGSGRIAVCQTANSPGEDDGNRLTVFDVEANAQLFSINPATGWASSYKFEEAASRIGAALDGIGIFYYDMQGQFLDAEKFGLARLNCDRYDVVLLAAEELLKKPELNDQLAQAALQAGKRACTIGANNDSSWQAVALKVQGLAHEFLHNDAEALAAFDDALKFNPKIGVKRKADTLRKRLGRIELRG